MDAMTACTRLNELHALIDLTELVRPKVLTEDQAAAESLPFVFGLKDGFCQIGLIGIVNGLLDDGVVAGVFEDGNLQSFVVLK